MERPRCQHVVEPDRLKHPQPPEPSPCTALLALAAAAQTGKTPEEEKVSLSSALADAATRLGIAPACRAGLDVPPLWPSALHGLSLPSRPACVHALGRDPISMPHGLGR